VTETATYITDEMQGIVGRPFGRQESFPISASDIRKWAMAVYYPQHPPAIFWDEQVARRSRFGGIVAPEEFNPFAWATADPPLSAATADLNFDYLEAANGVAGPGLPVNLNAGLAVRYGVRMRPGDVITSESAVQSYTEKTGRMGRMLITINRTSWHNQFGELVKQTDQTSIRYGEGGQ
jgi:hypothetical protein